MTQAHARGWAIYHIVAKIDPHCAMPIAGRQLIHNAVGGMGRVVAVRPDAKSPEATRQVEFVLASVADGGANCGQVQDSDDCRRGHSRVAAGCGSECKTPQIRKPCREREVNSRKLVLDSRANHVVSARRPSPTRRRRADVLQENILRVDAGRIDSVLNLVGELIIGKSMLQQALNEFSKRYPKELLRGKFADAMAFQARVFNDLQRSVMKIRMVPVDQLFRRFPRMVRDVSRQCGREVELDISGQDTDLDKGILDAIAEP